MKAESYRTGIWLVLGLFLLLPDVGAAAAPPEQCRRVAMTGQVTANHEWRRAFGQGWVFRIIPIKAGEKGYSGWDLVVDRTSGAGFPDALFVATPPYDSINQREIGTTFGVRAQDAIGWNPRSFRFLTSAPALRKAQKLYFTLRDNSDTEEHERDNAKPASGTDSAAIAGAASKDLMDLAASASAAGQLKILDATLTPGTANALPYAENWALQQRNTPHTIATTTSPTPYGKLDSLRFEITLWLPAGWKTPKSLTSTPSPCQ